MVIVPLASSALLRKPKVYNALITTDQNITPSRSYPIIQPHIHERLTAYPFHGIGPSAYNSFGLYDPYAPHLYPSFGGGYYHGHHEHYEPGVLQASGESRSKNKEDVSEEEESNETSSENETERSVSSDAKKQHKGPSEIPLNEFGLPPSLVSVNPYAFHQNPINLSPYPYNSYPLIYDQYSGGYNTNPYLPPFGYYPHDGLVDPAVWAPYSQPSKPIKKNPKNKSQNSNENTTTEDSTTARNEAAADPSQGLPENIKNYPKKNKSIPDVPPPPLPSGAKTDE